MTIKVVVSHEFDDSYDSSWLGEISAHYSPTALKRPVTDLPYDMMRDYRHNEFIYFEPQVSIQEERDYYTKHGYSKHDAYTSALSHALHDYNRLLGLFGGNWSFIGVVVKVFVNGIELGQDSLWGIESDDKEGIKEIEQQCIVEALKDAQNNLTALNSKVDFSDYEVEYK